jgi:NAD(P)-dependent dehydrogenase (short-subunit alcohol dehydrogenase family)
VKAQPSVAGKVVLITGGASGLGLATAQQLAARGARLALVDLNAEQVTEAARTVGSGAIGLVADVTDRAAITAALQQAADTFGRVDVVMANAGVAHWGTVLMTDPDRWERLLEINLFGAWRTASAALPFLLDSKGYLMFTASAGAAIPMPAGSAYGVSKAGVDSLGRTLRIELAHHGVDVGVGYYGFLDTALVAGVATHPGFTKQLESTPPPLNRVYPVLGAAQATADGIAARSARVMYPKRAIRTLLAVRGFLGRRVEASMIAGMPELEELARQEDARVAAGPTGSR